ncbi:hypothetical protein Cgig2_012150 [Carnegiea gigantea]|uniref:Squalene cyclase C-terminal domain-containing protein n=1 Tax=Carnegiea gigantea TaxID=171969 RepID=A0A9Q1KTF2_9CARY|nr:hypothetical protein Cgig2_012150 [Carnegiea gigantea]
MWKLKIAEGRDDPWLVSVNNHVGRQHWEFDPEASKQEERAELRTENPTVALTPPIKLKEGEAITEEGVITTLRRAINFFCSIQAHDGDHSIYYQIDQQHFFFGTQEGDEALHIQLPGQLQNYFRLVYMPMSYLYGKRFVGTLTSLVQTLRNELYPQPYEDIDWNKARNTCAKVLSMLACWVEDPNSEAYKRHLARVPDYLWVAEDGIKAQLRDNPSDNFKEMYRHIRKGAWPVEIADQGLQTSDCTAEALKASLLLSKMSPDLVGEKIEAERLYDAVDSKNGGFSSWEPNLSFRWMERFNPIEIFEDALIEREYGSWGICFTYGTFFAVDALVACGRSYRNSRPLRKACEFLLSKQLPDGGWGESYLSSTNKANIDPIPIKRGVRLLINSQMEDGEFPQQDHFYHKR